jgi:hypothetical protein
VFDGLDGVELYGSFNNRLMNYVTDEGAEAVTGLCLPLLGLLAWWRKNR